MGLGICLCINNKDIGIWPICDPKLVAIQNIVVTCRKIQSQNRNEVKLKQSQTAEIRF